MVKNYSVTDAENGFSGAARQGEKIKKVYQVALMQSLTQGCFEGTVKVSELKRHGDTGLGTFDGVNGEMIVLCGRVYQALGDGSVREADESETVPFSVVTFFDKDFSLSLFGINGMGGLKDALSDAVDKGGKNLIYTVKISGSFKKLHLRSVPKQKKPYKSLDKALADDQKEFFYENEKGTVVALYCPDYMAGLNAPGWHAHFISDDRTKGGHVLDIAFDSALAEFTAAQGFELFLPKTPDFQDLDLSKDLSAAIRKIETNED